MIKLPEFPLFHVSKERAYAAGAVQRRVEAAGNPGAAEMIFEFFPFPSLQYLRSLESLCQAQKLHSLGHVVYLLQGPHFNHFLGTRDSEAPYGSPGLETRNNQSSWLHPGQLSDPAVSGHLIMGRESQLGIRTHRRPLTGTSPSASVCPFWLKRPMPRRC